jgi:hypothetical protein
MIEVTGNVFDEIGKADALCITTNGIVRKNGWAICGAGVALAARLRWPDFEQKLGEKLLYTKKNIPHFILQVILRENITRVYSFPTKNDWRNSSDIELIKNSAKILLENADIYQWTRIAVPRPGCHNGGLNWSDVKKELETIFDDRFVIYSLD